MISEGRISSNRGEREFVEGEVSPKQMGERARAEEAVEVVAVRGFGGG